MIALKSVGVGVGDEVIVPPNSFAATENAVFAVGAKPVFVNIDSSNNIAIASLQHAVTSKTKAILPVCLYGSSRNIPEIYAFGKKNNLPVVLDAAQCFGIFNLTKFADIICLSFNPYKNIGSFGKSGAIIVSNPKYSSRARLYSYHGFKANEKNVKEIDWGYNSRMDNMQAATLIAKIPFFTMNAFKRCFLAHRYLSKLAPLENDGLIRLPIEKIYNTWHLFPVVCHNVIRNDIIDYAAKHNIEFDIYYPLLAHEYESDYAFKYIDKEQLKPTVEIHSNTFHIPLHNQISISEQDKVISIIFKFFNRSL